VNALSPSAAAGLTFRNIGEVAVKSVLLLNHEENNYRAFDSPYLLEPTLGRLEADAALGAGFTSGWYGNIAGPVLERIASMTLRA
jgi:hypothetical protein